MTHEDLEEAVPLYAVGALERPERQLLEAHLLSGCIGCHTALKEYQSVASLLPFGLPLTAPPRSLKAKILAKRTPALPAPVETVNQAAKPNAPSLEPGEWMNHLFPPIMPARSWPFRIAMGFATLLLIGGAGYAGWTLYQRATVQTGKVEQLRTALERDTSRMATLQRELSARDKALAELREELQERTSDMVELRDTVVRREAEIDDMRNQLALLEKDSSTLRKVRAQQEEFVALLKTPGVQVVSLTGSEIARGAGAFLLYDPDTKKAWLYAFNMPALPSGKIYQLWAIDEAPVSAGIFPIDHGQKGRLLIKTLPDFSRMKKFAVSVEPAGGRREPTGAIYLVGQL